MKAYKMSSLVAVAAAAAAMSFTTAASAGLLFDRGLPSANLNNAAGIDRSNVSWTYELDQAGNVYIPGDNFRIGSAGQQYLVERIVTWGVQLNPLDLDLYEISMYLGKSGGTLNRVATGSITGNANSSLNITHGPVTYSGGESYQGSDGSDYPIFEATFDFTIDSLGNPVPGGGLLIDGGDFYEFGVDGLSQVDQVGWFAHASNADKSGSTQEGADDRFFSLLLSADGSSASYVGTVDSATDGYYVWDKSSDLNVRIYGTRVPTGVPEPSSLALLGLALAGLAASRRGKKA